MPHPSLCGGLVVSEASFGVHCNGPNGKDVRIEWMNVSDSCSGWQFMW